MAESSLSEIAWILALVGGILLVIFGLLSFTGYSPQGPYGTYPLWHWEFAYGSIVAIIAGIIAILGAKFATTLPWAIVLIIVGLIGGGLGGALVFLGALIGLILALTGNSNKRRY